MEYCSQVGVAPKSLTMGTIKMVPKIITTTPNMMARKKAVLNTWLAFFSSLAPNKRAM